MIGVSPAASRHILLGEAMNHNIDPWITKDGYHLQDIIDGGRCDLCGRLAVDGTKTTLQGRRARSLFFRGRTSQRTIRLCDSDDCQDQAFDLQTWRDKEKPNAD
jgi:hypothetical protein